MENTNEQIRNDGWTRDQLLTFRNQLESARQDYNIRVWETIKLFFTIWPVVSAILSVIAWYPFQSGTQKVQELQLWQQIILITVPLVMLIFSFVLQRNIKRERRHLIELEVVMRRIEHYLGLMEKDSPIRVHQEWIKQYKQIDKNEECFIRDGTRIHWKDWKNFFNIAHSTFFVLFFINGLISEILAGYFAYVFFGWWVILWILVFAMIDMWWLKNA